MSNQINSQCWSFKPGSSVPLSQQSRQPAAQLPRQRNAPQSGQPGRVAGHTMDDNFIPAGAVPGNSSEGAPAIGQRGVNRQGQMPFKYTKTVSQQVIEGEATLEEIKRFFAADHIGPDFQVFPHLPCNHPDCIPCNDPQWMQFPTPPDTPSGSPRLSTRRGHNVNGPFGYTVHFNNNRQAMAQGQR